MHSFYCPYSSLQKVAFKLQYSYNYAELNVTFLYKSYFTMFIMPLIKDQPEIRVQCING